MSEVSRSSNVEPMVFNVDKILDAHTHLTGQESPEQILECMNACGVEKAFLFAPELDVETRRLTNDNMEDVRKHNDYCADVCSAAPTREEYRNMIFFENAYSHWQDAIGESQSPREASGAIEMPNALQAHSHG
jgi:adenosine deaminase